MKNFVSNTALLVIGVMIGIVYWVKRIACFPADVVLFLLSKLYLKIYASTSEGYFAVIPNNVEELEEYYKRAEEQVAKCNCEQCQTVLARAKMMKEMIGLAEESKKTEVKKEEVIEEIKCTICGTVCNFNGDTRVYNCPNCK